MPLQHLRCFSCTDCAKGLGVCSAYYALFALLSYAATGQIVYLVLPAVMGGLGGAIAALVFPHVATRFEIWLDPWASPRGAGYQIVQTMFALANGGWLGIGLGQGLARTIPASHTDLPLVVIGEELGFAGLTGCLTAEFLLAAKGLAISFRCGHGFLRLLGLSVVIGWSLSVFLVAGVYSGWCP